MSDIKKKVIAVIIITILIVLILIVLSIAFLGCSGDKSSIQTSISLIGNYVGAITTLAAAIIATYLFNDWRIQHNKTIHSSEALKLFKDIELYIIKLANYSNSVCNTNKLNKPFKDKHRSIFDKDVNLTDDLLELKKLRDDIVVDIRAFSKLIKSSPDNLGLKVFTAYFDDYFIFVSNEYIINNSPIDNKLMLITNTLKKQIPNSLLTIQSNLELVINIPTK